MRFTEDGPSIPDELLNARDEGRVVFFCGAGVSQARAGLPDFFGLAEKVIQELGASEESDARTVLDKARELGQELNVPGLISADRVFGLLERDFTIADIHAAVARSLIPEAETDLTAHQLLLRLATTPDSKTQLVTTNFDRLFEKCDHTCTIFRPPRLPNPSRFDDLDGIVYLHGHVNDEYSGADGDGFVLSSSEFGVAYLSEAWATEFFREVVGRYIVVFVGYSADDPPISYLLEGLSRTGDPSRQIFAFQAGESDEARARWHHKDVRAISYPATDGHWKLWETLELWAQRAVDPTTWRRTVLDSAMHGPEKLTSYQRGQVSHIVSTDQGAREFAERKPPASWLCVFDPSCRYERPGPLNRFDPESELVDPFSLFGLDSDVTPERTDRHGGYTNRVAPADARDCFAANDLDLQGLTSQHFACLRGGNASSFQPLPRRLGRLATWITNVANQPACVWWGARQESLHPGLRQLVAWQLDQYHAEFVPDVSRAWKYLLESWAHFADEPERDWYDLERMLKREGWNLATLRHFVTYTRPYLQVAPPHASTPTPPTDDANLPLWKLIRVKVECQIPPQTIEIADDWLERVIQGLRKNLELAVDLCDEVDDTHLHSICPIIPDERPDVSDFQRTRGLSGCVIRFSELFDHLIQLDVSKAQHEVSLWRQSDDSVFARLRFWATGKPEVATAETFGRVVMDMSDDVFWDSYHQRDLLQVLARRWGELPKELRKGIEDRILEGRPRWQNEEEAEYQDHKAWSMLNRLQWLANNGCEFSFDLAKQLAVLHPSAPKWKPEYAKHAAESREIRSGRVARNTEHSALLRVPIDSILSKAQDLLGRTDHDFLEERDPFAGLCRERPVRAYLALVHAARRNEYPEWAWKTFLYSSREKENTMTPRLTAATAGRICRFPDGVLKKMLYVTCNWLQNNCESLSNSNLTVFDRITNRLIDILQQEPQEAESALLGGGHYRDWATAALNSPVGDVAMSIVQDSRLAEVDAPVDPNVKWLTRLARLLQLNGDLRRHAIVVLSHHLGWFHHLTPDWTERHLLSIVDSENIADKEAFWAGVLWNPEVKSPSLFRRIKPALLDFAKQPNASREGHVQALGHLILWGWLATSGTEDTRYVSHDEFRDVLLHGGDLFRSQVLWLAERWLHDQSESGLDDKLDQAVEFFRNVWPRQRAVKNPQMSAGLVHLLVSSRPVFASLVEVVLPLLTKIERRSHLYMRNEEQVEIVNRHPGQFLKVLYVVLPDDVSDWPFDIAELLETIENADGELVASRPFRELQRRWNAR